MSDILMWLECYTAMVAVLSTKFLHKMPHLMAYQRTMSHWSYASEGWIVCYHRRASVTNSLDWGIIDLRYIMRHLLDMLRLLQDAAIAVVNTMHPGL